MKAIKIFVAAIMASAVMSCGTSSRELAKVDVELPTAAEVDSVSYLLGVNFGSMIKGNDFAASLDELNMTELKKGMQDFLKAEGMPGGEGFNEQFKVSPEKINQLFNEYLTKRQAYKAAVNLVKEEQFLADNAKKDGVQTTESGLQYKLISAGDDYKVQPQDTVVVTYKGQLLDGTVFDQNDSTSFPLTNVIKGWQEGLTLVGEGAKVKLYIPAELGYGNNPRHHLAKELLIFDIEVLKVNKYIPSEE